MSVAIKKEAVITEQIELAEGIYSMWINSEEIAASAKPGQFVSLYCRDGSKLMPRPISICEINRKQGTIRLVYRATGKGTMEFALLKPQDTIIIMGPLGNGFTLEGTKALLIGGGIGIPPMLELAKQHNGEKQIVLGFRDNTFLEDELASYGKVFVATEDGSVGTKGNVLDAIRENRLEADIIYACGPTQMLRGIRDYALEKGIICQLSLEERMACGIGTCLGCVCKTKEVDHHSNVKNARICKDGPVFYAEEVEL